MLSSFHKAAARGIKEHPGFSKALGLAKEVMEDGEFYVIGGAVYKSVIREIYGKVAGSKDVDFLSVNPLKVNGNYAGWEMTKNSYGNPRFVQNGIKVDFTSI